MSLKWKSQAKLKLNQIQRCFIVSAAEPGESGGQRENRLGVRVITDEEVGNDNRVISCCCISII